MGIVSSTFASFAIRFAWNCQRLLDPRYRCIEAKTTCEDVSAVSKLATPVETTESSPAISNRSQADNNSLHHENRNRRAAQHRFKTRPSSFDAALVAHVRNSNCQSPLRRQHTRPWEETSSSGCSSDSGSESDADSETELRVSDIYGEKFGVKDDMNNELSISAADEEAFRLTVGRGHFSKSKKDRFLNHLRLEKRLNDINHEFMGVHCRPQRHTLPRCQTSNFDKMI